MSRSSGMGSDPDHELFRSLREAYEVDCFELNKSTGCQQLAEYYHVVEKNPSKAAEIYQTNCRDRSIGKSCVNLGIMKMTGDGIPADQCEALDLFLAGCQQQCLAGCNNAAMALKRGSKEVPADAKRALPLFERACTGGLGNACFNLSDLHRRGAEGVPVDTAKALHAAEQGCALGHTYACVNASIQLARGDGVPPDPVRAQHYRDRAQSLAAAQAHSNTSTFEMDT